MNKEHGNTSRLRKHVPHTGMTAVAAHVFFFGGAAFLQTPGSLKLGGHWLRKAVEDAFKEIDLHPLELFSMRSQEANPKNKRKGVISP